MEANGAAKRGNLPKLGLVEARTRGSSPTVFFFAYTANEAAAPGNKVVHVGYYLKGQRVDLTTTPVTLSNWTTLRVVTSSSGNLEVFLDSTSVYSTNNPLLASATGAGLYRASREMGLVNRWDNFTVFSAP